MNESTAVASATEGEVLDLAGALNRIVLDGKATGGVATVVEATFLPGAGTPPHSDAREDLVWYVIEGSLQFQTPDDTRSVEAGGSWFCPRNSVHAVMNAGTDRAVALMVATPSGIEDFLREAAAMLPNGVPEGPPPAEAAAAFSEMAAGHGITVEGPSA